jgi:hypothetical protein
MRKYFINDRDLFQQLNFISFLLKDICKLLPNSVLESDCRLSFDPRKMKIGWYAVAIQIEDFINQTDTTPLSSVPIQFLINVLEVNKNCADL